MSSTFGRHLVVVGVFLWLFLHTVASSIPRPIGSPASPWADTLWVVAMTLALLAVEVRRKRLTEFFAALGLSRTMLLGAALIAVGVLEVFFWVAMAIVEVA